MSLFNSKISPSNHSTGILLDNFITVQAAAEVTGYCSQYLRRLHRYREAGWRQDRTGVADQNGVTGCSPEAQILVFRGCYKLSTIKKASSHEFSHSPKNIQIHRLLLRKKVKRIILTNL
jgi:hypothetical protein